MNQFIVTKSFWQGHCIIHQVDINKFKWLSLVVTSWERADLLALLYVMISCVFVIHLYGVLGQV